MWIARFYCISSATIDIFIGEDVLVPSTVASEHANVCIYGLPPGSIERRMNPLSGLQPGLGDMYMPNTSNLYLARHIFVPPTELRVHTD